MAKPKVTLNAWTGTGQGVSGRLGPGALAWGLGEAGTRIDELKKPAEAAKPENWRDPRVGWGLVLPARPGLTSAQLATADDAPEPIRALVAQRSQEIGQPVPVLRYHEEVAQGGRFLRKHSAGKDLSIIGSDLGMGVNELPAYLLIYAKAEEVPWSVQYLIATQRSVGRLDLEGDGLASYVGALSSGWKDAKASRDRAVVWAVAHGSDDITDLMRRLIARNVHAALREDSDIGPEGALFLDGKMDPAAATRGALAAALADRQPALVVTTSHGKTGPLEDPQAMLRDLGLLVDQDFKTLDPDQLLAAWAPDGAIWYAHACCSAGSASPSAFVGLFTETDPIAKVLAAVAALGDQVAPLPRRLLGHPKPLRAFIGHVEPTFDWTLKDPANGQPLAAALSKALYPNLYQPEPVGLAFQGWHRKVGGYHQEWQNLRLRFNEGEDLGDALLFPRLAANDVASTVILGDPTAVLPQT